MSAAAVIREHAAKLRREGVPPLPAVLAGVRHARDEQFMPIGDERVPWTLAEVAGGGRRTIEVEVGGSVWRNSPAVAPIDVAADQSDVLIELQRDSPTKAPVLPPAGSVSIAVDGAAARRYEYNLKEVRNALPPAGEGKQPWELTINLQGAAATDADAIALVSLVLRGNFGRSRSDRQEARLEGVAMRVQLRRVRQAAVAPAVAPANAAALAPATPAAVPPPIEPVSDGVKAAARAELLRGIDERAVSLSVVRGGGRVLYELGSAEPEPLGETARALTAAAVVQYALGAAPRGTPGAVVLNDRTLVAQLLEKSGATHVRDAFVAIYAQAGVESPSLVHLLSDSAGLPPYPAHTAAHIHGVVADRGGITASGDIERDFAAVLATTPVVAEPGAAFVPSPLGWALLLFVLPGWDRDETLARTLAVLAGAEHRDKVLLPAAVGDVGFQSIYRLWSGVRASAGAVGHMLSHPGWFNADVAGDMGWLGALLRGRIGVGAHMNAACGGWMHMRTADGHHCVATSGRHGDTTTTLAMLPAYNVSAVCIVRRDTQPVAPPHMVDRLARFMAALVGAVPAAAFVLLTPAESTRQARKRAAALLAASTVDAAKIDELSGEFGGRFVALNEPQLSLTLGKTLAPPSPAKMRYTMTVEHGAAERVQYVLVYDPDAPPNPADDAGSRGAVRLVDPVTHLLGEPVYFDKVSDGRGRAEPFVSVLGRVFARESMLDDMRAYYDANSAPAVRRREQQKAAEAARQQEAAAAAAAAKQRAASRLRDGEQSDSDDDDAAPTYSRLEDIDDELAGSATLIKGDLFDALAGSAPSGKRTQYGRWPQSVGTERNRAAALVYAYPAGGRVYPVGAWMDGPMMAFYD